MNDDSLKQQAGQTLENYLAELPDAPEGSRGQGLIPAANGDPSYRLPLPPTYVTGSDGRVRACDVEKDYTQRMEPQAIMDALAELCAP